MHRAHEAGHRLIGLLVKDFQARLEQLSSPFTKATNDRGRAHGSQEATPVNIRPEACALYNAGQTCRFPMDPYARARELIDAAHAADPKRTADGTAAEFVYADRMESWVARLVPAATPLLRLAARCQHLERWSVPRTTFPEGKAGYLSWRKSLYVKQAARAKELLLQAGLPTAEADEAATWVSKTALKTNPGTQALEDAACLVFLENEIADFAAQHAGYPEAKFVEILRKTWKKMSPAAQTAALGLNLPPDITALVRAAVA